MRSTKSISGGWDGLETIGKIWELDSSLQVVVCTADPKISTLQIHHRLGMTDKLVLIKKPFDSVEAGQIVITPTEKWNLAYQAEFRMADLESLASERTGDLVQALL